MDIPKFGPFESLKLGWLEIWECLINFVSQLRRCEIQERFNVRIINYSIEHIGNIRSGYHARSAAEKFEYVRCSNACSAT